MTKIFYYVVIIPITLTQNMQAPTTHLNHLQICYQAQHELRVQRIMKTIRLVESRGNYAAVGGSGEYGAYQFTAKTWSALCNKFFNKQLDITLHLHQDLVAKAWVESLIDKDYTNMQIASIWNSGRPQWVGVKGVNWLGVPYDVERYVYTFLKYLNNC